MRQRNAPGDTLTPAGPEMREKHAPLSEGMRKERRPHGFYSKMSDDDIISYSQGFMKGRGIRKISELRAADGGLYDAIIRLEKRSPGIMEKIGLDRRKRRKRDWKSMNDAELAAHARRFIAGSGISSMEELKRADMGLSLEIYKRMKTNPAIMDMAGIRRTRRRMRNWESMGDDEIVEYARDSMQRRGLSGRGELWRADKGLHSALLRREAESPGIMDRIGFERKMRKMRDWKSMGDDEIAGYARALIGKLGIACLSGLKRADGGLHYVLQERAKKNPGIMDGLGLEAKKRVKTDWESMDDAGLVDLARRFMAEGGISGKSELQEAHQRLYQALLRREKRVPGIMARIGFVERHKDWKAMGDAEIVACALHFMRKIGISRRKELRKADERLYDALRRRGLLDRVFQKSESARARDAVLGVIEALDSFGDEE